MNETKLPDDMKRSMKRSILMNETKLPDDMKRSMKRVLFQSQIRYIYRENLLRNNVH